MKHNQLLAPALLLAALAAPLHAGVQFAKGEVNLSATAQVSFTDRVAPNADSRSDTIYTFTPTISYKRASDRIDVNAALSAPFVRYGSNSALDSENTDFSLSGNVPYAPASRLSGSWGVNYFEGIQSNLLLNRNQSLESFGANFATNLRLLRNISLKATANYTDRNTDSSDLFSNKTTSYQLGVQGHNFIRGRIGAYATYQWQFRETAGDLVDDKDSGLNFGITGQILPERLFPKLDADLSFGLASSEDLRSRTGGRRNHLTLNGRLSYPATPKSNVSLTYRRNLSVSDDDRTVLSSNVNLSLSYAMNQKLGFGASVGHSSNEFLELESNRKSDATTFAINARYSIRRNWSAATFYNFRDNASDISFGDYSSSVFGVSSTIAY